MVTDRRVAATFFGAALATLALCALFLLVAGAGDENIRISLRVTARIAFLLLLVVFVARPLRQMFRTPVTAMLLRYRPLVGVAFAGVHTGHLGVLVYRAREVTDFELGIVANLPGALTYAVIFAMVLTTFSGPRRALGPKAWRILHKVGLYWITFAFAQTQLPSSLDDLGSMNWWLVAVFVAALVIRMTAFFASHGERGPD